MKRLLKQILLLMEMVKIEHTLFNLPFALIGMLLAARETAGGLRPITILWIVLAAAGARSAAMAFNRLADASYDARNPRTKIRHIPAGKLTAPEVGLFLAASIAVFLLAAALLGPLCLALSPIVLVVLLGYSYTKRFTSLCHLFLGLAVGIAPIGAWIAVKGTLNLTPLLLGAAVMFWNAGFDIIYALQDYDFDLDSPLYSLPKKLGKAKALLVSRIFHAIMLVLLLLVGCTAHLHLLYFIGVAVAATLIGWEQSLVHPDDLSRVNMAFFTLNGWISVSLLGFVLLDGWVKLF